MRDGELFLELDRDPELSPRLFFVLLVQRLRKYVHHKSSCLQFDFVSSSTDDETCLWLEEHIDNAADDDGNSSSHEHRHTAPRRPAAATTTTTTDADIDSYFMALFHSSSEDVVTFSISSGRLSFVRLEALESCFTRASSPPDFPMCFHLPMKIILVKSIWSSFHSNVKSTRVTPLELEFGQAADSPLFFFYRFLTATDHHYYLRLHM